MPIDDSPIWTDIIFTLQVSDIIVLIIKYKYKIELSIFGRSFTMTMLSMVVALAADILPASGQMLSGLRAENARLERSDDRSRLTVTMEISAWEIWTATNGGDRSSAGKGRGTRLLKSVSVYGRNRWFQALCANGVPSDGILHPDRPELLSYSDAVPYEDWMNGASLELHRSDYGCCERLSSEVSEVLGLYAEPPIPEAKAVKISTLSGRAYIRKDRDHPLVQLQPRGVVEDCYNDQLGRNDADITGMSVTIKGYASPEGKYEANDRLAKGRAKALKRYVEDLYHFDADASVTEHVAEDWDGLRESVENLILTNRAELLAIIDDPELDPDTKDGRMKLRYPAKYAQLLKEAYPGLRYSDTGLSTQSDITKTPKKLRASCGQRRRNFRWRNCYAGTDAGTRKRRLC